MTAIKSQGFTITDYDDRPIEVGTRVTVFGADPKDFGFVKSISDWDYDYSDELQRAVGFEPKVKVEWLDGSVEEFVTSEWNGRQSMYDEPTLGKVEELVALDED